MIEDLQTQIKQLKKELQVCQTEEDNKSSVSENSYSEQNELLKLRLQRDEFEASLKTSMLICEEWEVKYNGLFDELENVRAQLLEAIEENQRITDEKNQILAVNAILEKKVSIERSEKMTLLSEVESQSNGGQRKSIFQSRKNSLASMSNNRFINNSQIWGIKHKRVYSRDSTPT